MAVVKNLPSSVGDARDMGSIPGQEDLLEKGMATHSSIFLPGRFHGWRSLVDHSPWGHKQLDTTEHIHTHTHIYIVFYIIHTHCVSVMR